MTYSTLIMTQHEGYDVANLMPGDLILLANTEALHLFESVVGIQVARTVVDTPPASSQRAAWEGRMPLNELLRPPNYHGDLINIKTLILDHPYEALIHAGEEGWTFASQEGALKKPTTDITVINSYQGFEIEAAATTTGRGNLATIRARLWLGSVPLKRRHYKQKSGTETPYIELNTQATGGSPVRRHITKIRTDLQAFDELRLASRAIRLEVARRGLEYILTTPMRD